LEEESSREAGRLVADRFESRIMAGSKDAVEEERANCFGGGRAISFILLVGLRRQCVVVKIEDVGRIEFPPQRLRNPGLKGSRRGAHAVLPMPQSFP
jgi:hypothetical protein